VMRKEFNCSKKEERENKKDKKRKSVS